MLSVWGADLISKQKCCSYMTMGTYLLYTPNVPTPPQTGEELYLCTVFDDFGCRKWWDRWQPPKQAAWSPYKAHLWVTQWESCLFLSSSHSYHQDHLRELSLVYLLRPGQICILQALLVSPDPFYVTFHFFDISEASEQKIVPMTVECITLRSLIKKLCSTSNNTPDVFSWCFWHSIKVYCNSTT